MPESRGARIATWLAARPSALATLVVVESAVIAWWLVPLHDQHGELLTTTDAGVALCFVVAGVIAVRGMPDRSFGILLLAAAPLLVADAAHDATLEPWRFTAGLVLEEAGVPVLFALALSCVRTHQRSRWDVALVAMAALATWGWAVAAAAWEPPAAPCWTCPPAGNALFAGRAPFDYGAVSDAVDFVRLVLWAALAVTLLVRLARASRQRRRVLGPVALAGTVLALKLIADQAFLLDRFTLFHAQEQQVAGVPNAVLTACLALAVVPAALRNRLARSPLGELVADLARLPALSSLRSALARSLADPTLEVGYWVRTEARYVDESGQPLRPAPDRAVTPVEAADGGPLALLVHDPLLREHEGTRDVYAEAARFALERERLRAELTAQLAETTRSRARLEHAADAERRRIEDALRTGAYGRLGRIARQLEDVAAQIPSGPVAEALAEARTAVDGARAGLVSLARGVRPAALARGGLAVALPDLATAAPLGVELGAICPGRFDELVESAAYFVCSEGVANAAKHAHAQRVQVAARIEGAYLVVEVTDDGVGGASTNAGTGLRGLAERAEAVGGELRLVSPRGEGTRLIARFPAISSS